MYNHYVDTRSPPHLLDQIVLVDDASTMDHVKDELDLYMKQYPKVIVIATLKYLRVAKNISPGNHRILSISQHPILPQHLPLKDIYKRANTHEVRTGRLLAW